MTGLALAVLVIVISAIFGRQFRRSQRILLNLMIASRTFLSQFYSYDQSLLDSILSGRLSLFDSRLSTL